MYMRVCCQHMYITVRANIAPNHTESTARVCARSNMQGTNVVQLSSDRTPIRAGLIRQHASMYTINRLNVPFCWLLSSSSVFKMTADNE